MIVNISTIATTMSKRMGRFVLIGALGFDCQFRDLIIVSDSRGSSREDQMNS